MEQIFKCPCGGINKVEFDQPEEKNDIGRVIPCMRCYHEKNESWVQDEKGKRLEGSSRVVKKEDGTTVKERIPGAQHMHKSHPHGRKIRCRPSGSVEVTSEATCDCA